MEATFLVGRGPFNHVVLDDATISRQHAKISAELEGHVVYDLGSANGTFINDEPVKRKALAAGDRVRFGPFSFQFEAGAHEPLPAPKRLGRSEEATRVGFEAPSKIIGEADAQGQRSLITMGGLSDLESAERRLKTLFAFVHAISTTLDTSALLDLVVENLFQAFPIATLSAVYVVDEASRAMVPRRAQTRDGREVVHYPLSAHLHVELVDRGKALLTTPLTLDFEQDNPLAPRTEALLMHSPMIYRGETLGVLHVRCDPGTTFTQADLDLLTALGSHAALAMQNATLHQASLTQQRMQRDLALAQQIQKSFLPLQLPTVPGLTFAAEYQPAYDVGGDFYDLFWIAHDRIGCVIGDVSGKGISAALLMARVSSDLRTALMMERPEKALGRVNREIVARQQHDLFVTAIALVMHVPTGSISFANAGHMPPYVVGPGGELLRIEEGASSPLGLDEEMPFSETSLILQPGETLVLTTDGVHEATSPSGEQLGFEGVERSLRAGPPDVVSVHERLLVAVKNHVQSASQYDDLTLVLCGRSPR